MSAADAEEAERATVDLQTVQSEGTSTFSRQRAKTKERASRSSFSASQKAPIQHNLFSSGDAATELFS